MEDKREDILVRPNNDVPLAPFSVYLDISPKHPNDQLQKIVEYELEVEPMSLSGSFVSDSFRVWELLDDCHNLATAEERWRMYQIDPEFKGQAIKIRSNEAHWWITDHPVFHMTTNTDQ